MLFMYKRWVKPKLLFIAFCISPDRHEFEYILVWPTKSILFEWNKFSCVIEVTENAFPDIEIITSYRYGNNIMQFYLLYIVYSYQHIHTYDVCLSTRLLDVKYNLLYGLFCH